MVKDLDPTEIDYSRPLIENPLIAYNNNDPQVKRKRKKRTIKYYRYYRRGREIKGLRDWILIFLVLEMLTGPFLMLAIAELIARLLFRP